MQSKYIIGAFLLVVLALVGLSFFGGTTAPEDGKLSVTASFYPIAYFAQEIGGERARVVNLTPAGAEPHDYEPSPQDLVAINESALFIVSGNDIEPWAPGIISGLDSEHTVSIIAGEGLATLMGMPDDHEEEGEKHEEEEAGHEEEEAIVDPHVWLSPVVASAMADSILQGFMQADPANATYYKENAAALKTKLAVLDSEYRVRLASCKRSEIITSHAAFGYLAREYGLTQISIAGLSPEDEPTASELTGLAEEAREHGITHIFFETLVSPKLAQTLANELGIETLVLNPLEGLTATQLSAGEDYLTQMRVNLENLSTALACTR